MNSMLVKNPRKKKENVIGSSETTTAQEVESAAVFISIRDIFYHFHTCVPAELTSLADYFNLHTPSVHI
jgi:hypothetical protein